MYTKNVQEFDFQSWKMEKRKRKRKGEAKATKSGPKSSEAHRKRENKLVNSFPKQVWARPLDACNWRYKCQIEKRQFQHICIPKCSRFSSSCSDHRFL
jgi:hypothetical protein